MRTAIAYLLVALAGAASISAAAGSTAAGTVPLDQQLTPSTSG
jgi:hypothetical protein